MFERFTDRARRVLTLGLEHVRIEGRTFMHTGDLLLGLAQEEGGVASQVLAEMGITPDSIIASVASTPEMREGEAETNPEVSLLLKEVLEMSLREALQLGHNYIGTEHMLLALIRASKGKQGYGTWALTDLTSPEDVRKAVIDKLQGFIEHKQRQDQSVGDYVKGLAERAKESAADEPVERRYAVTLRPTHSDQGILEIRAESFTAGEQYEFYREGRVVAALPATVVLIVREKEA